MVVTIFNLKGQLVGNFIKSDQTLTKSEILNENSPETLRENLKILSIHHPKHKKPSSNNDFGYYLAGLIEGDGHFNKQNQLIIAFHEKDISLAYFLKSYIKFGHVRKIKDKAALIYVISNKEGILKTLNLINGKMRTDLKWNQVKNNITYEFNWLPLNKSPLKNNWWLAGFIDADGSFQIKIINRENRNKPEIRLNLQIDAKKDQILKFILNEFGGNLGYRNKNDTYYYQSVSFGVAAKYCNYLRKYHLLSYKYRNYLKWYKVYLMIQDKKHLIEEGFNKIIKIKNSMKY